MTPDVNVLLAAHRADHVHHGTALAWLSQALAAACSGGPLHLLPMVATAFLRVATHPKVFEQPTRADDAIRFIDAVAAAPGCEWLELSDEWPGVARLCRERGITGAAVSDAWIAAAVRRHGTHLVTFDRDFARLLDPSEFTLLPAQPKAARR
jgi:toxin-antitoxin system PIN domain toxin